ncbi:hypothetical protein ACFCXF_33960 [Streptomyces virginiae]|uniref:hypothetical protein n=1 Tax=Streptomyces virginiae TaxID=1961 RepID=UPI00131B898C|nr:hypothetical protein [Streptomyces virginiae]
MPERVSGRRAGHRRHHRPLRRNILTEDHGDVADVLHQLEAAGMKQAMEAHQAQRTTA